MDKSKRYPDFTVVRYIESQDVLELLGGTIGSREPRLLIVYLK